MDNRIQAYREICANSAPIYNGLACQRYAFKATLDGVEKTLCLHHYQLPIPYSDRAGLQRILQISDMDAFSSQFADGVNRNVSVSSHLNRDGVASIVKYYQRLEDTESNSLFLVSDSYTPLADFFAKHTPTVNDVMDIGCRLLVILRDCAEKGFVHNNVTASSVLVGDDGKYYLGGFQYASKIGEEAPHKLPTDILPFDGYLTLTGREYDTYCVASLVWDLLGGGVAHYCAGVRIPPASVPKDLLRCLCIGLRGNTADLNYFRHELYEQRACVAKTPYGAQKIFRS